METALLVSILAIAVLLLLSGLFSGSETALTAASRARMHHQWQTKQTNAQYSISFLAQFHGCLLELSQSRFLAAHSFRCLHI